MGTRSYAEDLARWARERGRARSRQDAHVVAFLAVRGDVRVALEAGYAMKTIWEHMRETGRLRCRYETFTLHVKRFLKADADSALRASHGSRPPPADRTASPAPSVSNTSPNRGSPTPTSQAFTFDPNPSKEDLL